MKASKSTSTALARVLALPLMAGLLAGCDYASKLPDAPTTLGYELQAQKPPSITAPRTDLIGPPVPPAPPTRTAALTPPPIGGGLDTQALRVSPGGIEVPRAALALPPTSGLPAPTPGSVPRTGLAGPGTGGEPPAGALGAYTPPPTDFAAPGDFSVPDDFAATGYQGPQPGMADDPAPQFPEYAPVAFDGGSDSMLSDAPMTVGSAPVAMASLPADTSYQASTYEAPTYETQPYETQPYEPPGYDAPGFEQQPSNVLYSAQDMGEPLPYGVDAGQDTMVETTPIFSPSPSFQALPQASPITVLHARLDNGAVVKVHPVVGAPGATSGALARTIASELGAQVDASAIGFAPAVFDLRASASRGSNRAEAEWKLFSSAGALVGVFPEIQPSGTWESMGDDAVQAMGRRVADRLRRNTDLRRATLTSVASAPPITSIDYAAVLPSGAPSLAPMPRPRPVRMAQLQPTYTPLPAPLPAPVQMQPIGMQPILDQPAPVQFAELQPAPLQPAPLQAAPQQYVVNTMPLMAGDPMANAVPRRRPEGVRTASLAPTQFQPVAQAMQPVQPVAPMLEPILTQPSAPPTLSPISPLADPSIPAPSFDTLRAAATDTAVDGPRALVFRGVRGAPGNGDQALGREVSRLLGQSGAQLAPSGTPNALYLTADVSRTRNGGSDSIKIMWHVEEADGTRVGQVVQENDVPAGALDANWGEDAFYAAQGARDGIMELLRTSGALDA